MLLALVVLVAACGGDDDSDETTAAPAPSIADSGGTAEDGEGASAETPAPAVDDDAGSNDDGVGAGDLPGVLSSDDCIAAASAFASAFSGGFTAEGTFDAGQIEAAFDRMSEVAPSEIKDDLATIADALGEYFSILEEANVDLTDPAALTDPDVQAALQRAGEKLDTSDFEEVSENVNQWFEGQCEGVGG